MVGRRSQVERREVVCSDGAILAAWVVGPTGGPPVLLASGAGADHRGWQSVLPELCDSETERTLWAPHGQSLAEQCRVAVFDQRGTGESVDVPPADSAGLLGSDLLAVGRATLDTPCTVVGHSMGGMAALNATLDEPDAVCCLGLIATTAGGAGLTWPSDAYLHAAAAQFLAGDQQEPAAELELAVSARFPLEQAALFDAFARRASAQPRVVDPEALAQVLMSHGVAGRLGEIRVPTVVVCGSEDQVHPPPNSSFLAEHLTRSRFVLLEGAGHLLNVEAPEVLIEEIRGLADLA